MEKKPIISVFTDESSVTSKSTEIEAVVLPTTVYDDLYATMKLIDAADTEALDNNLNDDDKLSIGMLSDGLRVTVAQGSLVKPLRDIEARWEQEPTYADKLLTLRELTIGSNKPGGKITGTVATARFYNQLGLGGLIQVPLWHSGFWITLKAIKEIDLLNLEMAIANNQITLGRETNTLIFSNYSVVFVRLVMEFITRHIQSCTLELTNLSDITKYIKIQDLYPLINGLNQAIYLKGFKDIRNCINTSKVDEATGKPKCNYIMTSTVDPKKLLWVNKKALSDKHMETMIKRSPNTVTINEALEYQNTLSINKPKSFILNTENNSKVTIELDTPFINKHITSGEKWIKEVISLTEKLFTESLSTDEKNIRISRSSKLVLLGIYSHYFKSIKFEDDAIVDDTDTINEMLEIAVGDKVLYKEILKAVRDYIDDNVLAIVAIPNYTCPVCKEQQIENDTAHDEFQDLIPINVLETFFDLSTLKNARIQERNLD